MSRFRRQAIAALALAALLLAGCGDDSGDDVSAPGDTVEAASTEADSTDDTSTDEPTSTEAIPDACSLVEASELEALVPSATPESETDTAIDGLDYSQCIWETDDTMLVVAVIASPARFEMHEENLPGEPVEGIGESAIVAPGISSETKGATGGRTVSALVDGNTLVVGVRLTGETTNEDVVPLATAIAERLS